MDIDRKLAYAGIVALFSLAAVFAFQADSFADRDYAVLLREGMTVEALGMTGAAAFVLLPLIVYLAAAYALRADDFHALLAALLFAACGANYQALFSIPPALALIYGRQYGIFEAIGLVGAVLPLGMVAVAKYRERGVPAAIAAAGLVAIPFAPGLSAILLALAAPAGIAIMGGEKYGGKALVVAVAVFAFQGVYAGDLTAAVVVAAFVGVIAYVAASLHKVDAAEVSAFALLLFAFSCLVMLNSIGEAGKNALGSDEIAAFSAAKTIDGKFYVFDYANAFSYYSGKGAEVLNASALLRKGSEVQGNVALSPTALDRAYGKSAIVFAYAGAFHDASGGSDVAVFANEKYVIYMAVSGGELAVADARMTDRSTGESAIIPFTKIKQTAAGSYKDPQNRMVNVQELDGTGLYSILFKSTKAFSQNGSEIVKVQ